jgi:hypothetical protein
MDTSSFTLDIDVWVSASKDSSNPSFKPTAPFLCIIPDSPRYKTHGKPIPYNRRFVAVTGTLSDVVYKDSTAQDVEIERFVITVDDITFLGQPSDSASTPAKQIPNTLDGNTRRFLIDNRFLTYFPYRDRSHTSKTPQLRFFQGRQACYR